MSSARKKTYHHGDLKRALTDAALSLVAEKGPKGFTLTEAARRAGVSVAAPYRHFADKADLLAAVAEQGFVELHQALTAVTDTSAAPMAQVLTLSRAYVRWAVTHPDHYQVMFGGETVKAEHPGLLVAGAAAFGDMLDAITRCQDAGVMPGEDPIELAGPLWSLIHGIASLSSGVDLHHMGITEDPEALVTRAVTQVLRLGEPG